jgi:hypothetical protein
MGETSLVVLAGLWALRRQRYIVFPLLLASVSKPTFLNFDFNIKSVMQEVQALADLPQDATKQFELLKHRVEGMFNKNDGAESPKTKSPTSRQ